MPNRLHRYYGAGYLHFITTSCYHRRPLLARAASRDLFLQVLEQVRKRYDFVVVGYVVMPEHVHLLFSEPAREDPSVVMKSLKQSFARKFQRTEPSHVDPIWQHRFYDFVVFSEKKRIEKLNYMHQNPVKRGLVTEPERWRWSSFNHYMIDERGPILVNEAQKAELKVRKIA